MKVKRSIIMAVISVVLLLPGMYVFSQTVTQMVKGKVVDNETQVALPGANVVILGTNPLLGVASDIDGNYKISNVPVGRYNIQVSYLGYDATIISEILVSSGKELILNINLKQSVTQMNEVTVKAYSRKDQPINTMASISARSFTVEETRRYAGGLDDPARMASAFAGVTVGNIQDNAIIIRGNAPKGVSWRLEGVEVPNPNHFAGGNVAGGGAVTIFSSQLLANSDFFTGAFPAEYGNALAGVFDMKLRNGNQEKRENTIQAGILGIDLSSEGPFKKGHGATYLFNYRYSTFGLLSSLHIIPSGQVPKYQDLSFKLNFPAKKAGNFSLWGIGALDDNIQPRNSDSAKWKTDWDRIYYDWKLNMGTIGLTHKASIGKRAFINTTIAASGIQNKMNATRYDDEMTQRPEWYFVDRSEKIIVSTFVNYKFSSRQTLKAGVNFNALFYNLNLNSTINEVDPATFQNFVNQHGQSTYSEFFIESKYSVTSNLVINAGLNANYFALNSDYSIEPRMSIKWEFHPHHSFSFGYGLHSQLEELKIYFVTKNVNGRLVYPNKNLGLAHAQHFVLGYDWLINDNLRFKIEPYYQYLYNVPGIRDSSYSMINFKQDWSFSDSLANNSKGRNVGVDFTLEHFLQKGFYFLITASIFDSKYKASDGIWRNTRYNKGYAVNLLLGKEFYLRNNKILGINGRFNYIGGERYSPVLVDKSLQNKEVFYDESRAFEKQFSPTYYLDLAVTYRINKRRHSSVWALQVKNILGSPSQEGFDYYYRTHTIEPSNETVILPVLSYKIEF